MIAIAVTIPARRLENGGGQTGWSRAWIINFFARLGDGAKAHENLRALFEIDPTHIAAATLVSLARCGAITSAKAGKAVRELGIDPDKADPLAL